MTDLVLILDIGGVLNCLTRGSEPDLFCGCLGRSSQGNGRGMEQGRTTNAALAEAQVAANYREAEVRPQRRPTPDLPLFAAE